MQAPVRQHLTAAPRSPTMSSVRGSDGSPCTVISRYDACSFDAHRAVSRPGTLTHGVSIGAAGITHGGGGAAERSCGRRGARYACSSPLPPPSAAGLVHAATMSASGDLAEPRVRPAAGWSSGTTTYVIDASGLRRRAAERDVLERAADVLAAAAPRQRRAEQDRRHQPRLHRLAVDLLADQLGEDERPCEWPTSTTPRPWLSCSR